MEMAHCLYIFITLYILVCLSVWLVESLLCFNQFICQWKNPLAAGQQLMTILPLQYGRRRRKVLFYIHSGQDNLTVEMHQL
jgi:hypothetical protein